MRKKKSHGSEVWWRRKGSVVVKEIHGGLNWNHKERKKERKKERERDYY